MADGDLDRDSTTASHSASVCGFDSHHRRRRCLAARLPLHDLQLPGCHGVGQPHGLGLAPIYGSSGDLLCHIFFSSGTLDLICVSSGDRAFSSTTLAVISGSSGELLCRTFFSLGTPCTRL